jgi:hypothetical protein
MDVGTESDPVPIGEHAARNALTVHERTILRVEIDQFNASSATLEDRVIP